MKLDLKDRLVLSQVLPQQASMQDIGNVIECARLLALTDKETDEFGFKASETASSWNPDADTVRDIELKHEHVAVLKKTIKELDEKKEVAVHQYETFLKILKL